MQVAIWTLCIFVQHTSSMCGWFFAGIRGSPIGTSSLWRDASTSLVARLWPLPLARWCLRSVHDSSPYFLEEFFHGNQVTQRSKSITKISEMPQFPTKQPHMLSIWHWVRHCCSACSHSFAIGPSWISKPTRASRWWDKVVVWCTMAGQKRMIFVTWEAGNYKKRSF